MVDLECHKLRIIHDINIMDATPTPRSASEGVHEGALPSCPSGDALQEAADDHMLNLDLDADFVAPETA